MSRGANELTNLNSGEDPDLVEKPEDEVDEPGDDEEDCGIGDWDIDELTDEGSDAEFDELPKSACASAAKDKEFMKETRYSEWGYKTSLNLTQIRRMAISTMGLGVQVTALTGIAVLFYDSSKLWSQITVENNRYNAQSIPVRARAIRTHQRRNKRANDGKCEVEDLGEIRRRLASVQDIKTWEIMKVIALLIARMLVPVRKGIAAHWAK
ncbi:hypothetical protein PHMEG_00012568 [Phytophthora megakarya]|uniref:Uncharacterized protein n=1 Tax=Phytophthora megakarya TaxID=4795 RepID=A0A225W8V6_9STRA|nr:hypothetical protein PHMEG_00012568 [Phytophthora megakarya]